ncbi:hypothetical protein GX50_00412 [[Emmonsia] crescens]|uniref:Protein kinase domain-containing protein n=1 Tax=[Emmonsia] crescens TaxID=73230 RepID=A0A2B7ZUT7_9EURO|nr:hypothetical protein GX50_00412 [Emmonsia crescens]
MDNRVQELLAELERERRLREAAEAEARKQREQREEEQRRREKAEALSANSEPTTLLLFLRACHELFLAICIVTDPTKTTQGPVTKPTNRTVPSLIKIWDSFNDEQTVVWQTLNGYPSFLTEKLFPSKHQLDYVRQRIAPITSEWDLRYYERDTVENQVQDIVDKITKDKALRDAFGLRGSVTFESHTNLGHPEKNLPSEGGQQNPSSPVSETKSPAKKKRKNQKSMEKLAAVTAGQADRFCIYRQDGSEHIPAIAIEYKAPHKLTKAEMDMGLIKEIRPAQDVINQESDDVEFCCRRLVAAVITQLFSYMVRKGVRYGYVCTGEAFIFVHIPDDPSSVQCALCIPNLNIKATDDSDSQLTAVAQVLAFTVIALKSPPVSQQWHDAASRLDVWPVEYSEILEQTPPAARLKNASPLYRGRRPRDLPPLKMSLRSGGGGCRPSECDRQSTNSPSPPPPPSSPSFAPSHPAQARRGGSVQLGKPRGAQGRGKPSDTHQTSNVAEPPAIKTRPYCSQKCLLALRDGGPFDPSCPSYQDHQKGQINIQEFCSRMQTQLATDRGPDADCRPLYKAGSCGALFKVRLSSHGYTLVAKGVEYKHRHKLEHEMLIYNRLQDLQGEFVPVCLGVVQLVSGYPYYYDEGIYTHMLFLSWAGEPVQKSTNSSHAKDILSLVSHALRSIHSKGVLHGDAELRNILWNPTCKRPMIVDFERAAIRHALSDVPGNSTGKRRRVEETGFSKEIERIEAAFDRYVA